MLENIINLQILSFLIAILLGLTIHEFSHAFVANYLGDPTAKYAGRLSLNPIRHLDPLGTVLLLIFLFTLGLGFGWGKPVPVNPYNLKHKHGELLVSLAGPFSNFLLAILIAVLLALLPPALTAGWSQDFIKLFYTIILVNVMLGLFNLLPIPPLDGSKVLFDLLPAGQTEIRNTLEKYGFVILIAIIFFGITFLGAVAYYIYHALLNLSALLHGIIY
jgi:Zn-dependent protease